MEFCLHIGTEKTGSSALQTMAALGRPALAKAGVFFAAGWPHDEACMARGQISAGNARLPAKALAAGDRGALRSMLEGIVRDAKAAGAGRVLLSSEWLLPALREEGSFDLLSQALNEAGVQSCRFLVILRSPPDQLVSLYKHRAKAGTAGDIASWCETGYDLPAQLSGFRKQAEAANADLTVRGYRRDNGGIERQFFGDWLGVAQPEVAMPGVVNPSLTLPELALLRHLAKSRPALVEPAYAALAALPVKSKTGGAAISDYAAALAVKATSRHADEWAAWISKLPEDERFEIAPPPETEPVKPDELSFTEAQLHTIAGVMAESQTARHAARQIWRRVKPALSHLRHSARKLSPIHR